MPFAVVDEVVCVVVSLVEAYLEALYERLGKEGFQLRIDMVYVCPVVSGFGLIEVLEPHCDERVAVQIGQDVVLQFLAAGKFGALDGFVQDGLPGGLGNLVTDEHLAGLVAVDLDVAVLHTHPDESRVPVEGPSRNVVEVAMEVDGVVLAHKVFLHPILRVRGRTGIRRKVGLLFLEGFGRDTLRGAVGKAVRRPCEPAEGGLVQHLDVGELAAAKEPVLDVLHDILHLPFGLRVAFPAEHALEVLGRDKGLERFRQHEVSEVFTMDEDFVLVIDDLPGFASIEPERQLVGVYGQVRRERCLAEVNELMPAIAHHRHEEVHLHPPGIVPVHPVFPEVRLHGDPGSGLLKFLEGAESLLIRLRDTILVTDAHHKVEHRLFTHSWEVRMMLAQMVMDLAA